MLFSKVKHALTNFLFQILFMYYMKKIGKNLSYQTLGFMLLGVFLSFGSYAQQANEAAAAAWEKESILAKSVQETEGIVSAKEVIVSDIAKTAPASSAPKTAKELNSEKKIQKIANSKLVKWAVKRAIIKSEKKRRRKELRQVKEDKVAQEAIRNASKQRVKNIKQGKDVQLSGDIRMGLILLIIGILITILPGAIFTFIGTIVAIVGLVIILFALI